MPLMMNPVPFDCDKHYQKGDIVTHNGEVYEAPDTILPGPFNRSEWHVKWDYHCLIEKINELQFQHWMTKSSLFHEKSRYWDLIHSEWGSAFAQHKSKLYGHASEVCKKVAHERYEE